MKRALKETLMRVDAFATRRLSEWLDTAVPTVRHYLAALEDARELLSLLRVVEEGRRRLGPWALLQGGRAGEVYFEIWGLVEVQARYAERWREALPPLREARQLLNELQLLHDVLGGSARL